jgi:uracil-DNA glycosylase
MLDVVDDPDGDAAGGRIPDRPCDDRRADGPEVEVVLRTSSVRSAPLMKSAIRFATCSAVWPPSVRVVTSMLAMVETLAAARIGRTHNFYRDGSGASERRARLAGYLESRAAARWLLVGEAAGYRGARVSGIPFTSERQLTGRGPAEATATIVHRVLAELGAEEDVLLWNLVPTHPHLVASPRSNRPPTTAEIASARPFLDTLAGGRRVVAVGRLAERALGAPALRHPSHGGARAFRDGLVQLLR